MVMRMNLAGISWTGSGWGVPTGYASCQQTVEVGMAEDENPPKPRGLVRRLARMAQNEPDESTKGLSQLNLAFSFGVASILSMYLGYLFGRWVDRLLGTDPFGMFIGVLLGVGASFKMLITDILGDTKKGRGNGQGKDDGVGRRPEE